MERINVSDGLPLTTGQLVEVHYPAQRASFRNAVDAAVNGVGAFRRPHAENQNFPIKDCVVERVGDVIHVWAPGTEKNP
jgi:hypothetical protein